MHVRAASKATKYNYKAKKKEFSVRNSRGLFTLLSSYCNEGDTVDGEARAAGVETETHRLRS